MLARCVAWMMVVGLGGGAAHAQIASALILEDGPIPGSALADTVASISNADANENGGFAFTINTSDGVTTFSRIWGTSDGTSPGVLRTESTFGDFEQVSFEAWFGLANDGTICYGTSSTNTSTGTTSIDGVFLDDAPLLNEFDAAPGIAGNFITFNSRPAITEQTAEPFWIAGITDVEGSSSSQSRVLYRGDPPTPVLMAGDVVPGAVELLDTGSGIDFDFKASASGTNFIVAVNVDTGGTTDDTVLTLNGSTLMINGLATREASPVPNSAGAMPGELWDSFDYLGVNEAGDYMFTGDTDADSGVDEFICVNGVIVMREGDPVQTPLGSGVLATTVSTADMNENGDWAAVWNVRLDADASLVEALIVNESVELVEGMAVDFNGDGVIDGSDNNGILSDITGLANLAIGSTSGTTVNVYFTGDVDTAGTTSSSDDTEGGFCLPVETTDVCACETTGDDVVNISDLLEFLSGWFDSNGGIAELLSYLACWFPVSAGGPC